MVVVCGGGQEVQQFSSKGQYFYSHQGFLALARFGTSRNVRTSHSSRSFATEQPLQQAESLSQTCCDANERLCALLLAVAISSLPGGF
jgi:hypothetical protein